MASINGVELKNVTEFLGHEEEPLYQGNLYLGGKKIAFWSQDSWGAICDNLYMERGFSEERLREKIKSLNKDKAIHGTSIRGKDYTIDYDIEKLTFDLLDLKDDERRFNSAVKKGYGGTAVIKGGNEIITYSLAPQDLLSDEGIKNLPAIQKSIQSLKARSHGDEVSFKVYRSKEDFKVGEKINLKEITR